MLDSEKQINTHIQEVKDALDKMNAVSGYTGGLFAYNHKKFTDELKSLQNVKVLMGHGFDTLRNMQDQTSQMFQMKHEGKYVVHSVQELQQMEEELTQSVFRLCFPEDFDYTGHSSTIVPLAGL